ncbi:MAG: DNA polymerase III subunit delta [Pseudomonadota bacterium]
MQVKPEAFADHLAGDLAPVYLISGDETLIVEETCDALLRAANGSGYTERSIHHVEPGFHWHDLTHDAASMSLFAERKVLDVRIGNKKFDREASEVLRAWTADLPPGPADNLLVLRTGRLDPRQRNSAWFKALDAAGVVVLVWPIGPGQLPGWLAARARTLNLTIEREAVAYLAEKIEGNLLAASQELHKLALLDLPAPITLEAVIAASEDSSRFNSFDLLDAMMQADAAKTQRILAGLREEGVALFAVLGALTSALRRLGNTRGMPPQRQRLSAEFARRIKDVRPVLAEIALIDQQGKGQHPGDAWLSLEQVVLRLAGLRDLSLPSRDLAR